MLSPAFTRYENIKQISDYATVKRDRKTDLSPYFLLFSWDFLFIYFGFNIKYTLCPASAWLFCKKSYKNLTGDFSWNQGILARGFTVPLDTLPSDFSGALILLQQQHAVQGVKNAKKKQVDSAIVISVRVSRNWQLQNVLQSRICLGVSGDLGTLSNSLDWQQQQEQLGIVSFSRLFVALLTHVTSNPTESTEEQPTLRIQRVTALSLLSQDEVLHLPLKF